MKFSLVLFALLVFIPFLSAFFPSYSGLLLPESNAPPGMLVRSHSLRQGLLQEYSDSGGRVGFRYSEKSSPATMPSGVPIGYIAYVFRKSPTERLELPSFAQGVYRDLNEIGRVEDAVWVIMFEAPPGKSIRVPVSASKSRTLIFPLYDEDSELLDDRKTVDHVLELAAELSNLPPNELPQITGEGNLPARLAKALLLSRQLSFGAGANPRKVNIAAVSVNAPPGFFYGEIAVYFSSKNQVLYGSGVELVPAACEKSIVLKKENLELSSSAGFFTGRQKVVMRRDGEIEPAKCSVVFFANAEIAGFPGERDRVESKVTFRRVFEKNRLGESEKTRTVSVFFHPGGFKAGALAEKIIGFFQYMQDSPAFGVIPFPSHVYLFKDALEMYKETGSEDPLSVPGVSFLNAKDTFLCPAIAGHEINHQAYFAAIDKYPRAFLEIPKDVSLFWLSEGTATFYARKATGQPLTSIHLLWLITGQIPVKTSQTKGPLTSVNFDKLTDLEQVMLLREQPPDLDLFGQLAGYHGSSAFLEYLDARFGLESVEAFFRAFAGNKNAKISLEDAFRVKYSEIRKGFNLGLRELNRVFKGPPPSMDVDAEKIDSFESGTACVPPKYMLKEAATARKFIKEYLGRIAPQARCTQFKARIALETSLASDSPPLAVLRAIGVLDAARVAKCLKK